MNYSTLALIIYLNLARITNNDPECEIFKGKIGANGSAEKNAAKPYFGGTVSFQPGTANLEVQLHYTDDEYFNDPKYKGLTKEDGIDNELTCLDLKLLKFLDNTYNRATQEEITDLTPVDSSNQATRWRYLTYTIPGDQLKTRLVASESTTNYVYTGYYALAYYIENDVQFTYYFSFSVTRNKTSNAESVNSYLSISNTETLGCKSEEQCTFTPLSSVSFCTNGTCLETITNPTLRLNDHFWLIQKITTPGFTQNYLSDADIWFTGGGLNKRADLYSANYSVVGQAIYQLGVALAWKAITIKLNSKMKITAPSNELFATTELTLTIVGQIDTSFQQLPINLDNCKPGQECLIESEETNPEPDEEIKKNNQSSSAKILLLIGLALFSFLF